MKRLLLCTALTMFAILNSVKAQLPNKTPGVQIPNCSFENWTNMGSYSNPNGWGTLNNTTAIDSVFTATKGTPGNPGYAHLTLTSRTMGSSVVNGIAVSGKLDTVTMQPLSGFAYNQRPQEFTGKWRHMIYGSSQGSVSAKLTKWNTLNNSRDIIATASQTLAGMEMGWGIFTVNFVYQDENYPDSCIIILKASGASPTDGDYLSVDNLSFSESVTGMESQNNFLNNMAIYPNPGSKNISINLNLEFSGETIFELIDFTGKIVLSKIAFLPQGESTQTFDISTFAKGAYFLRILGKSASETRKIIIE